ncbi:hypothetical protein CYMTET_41286 [Cymbomonas tetramitiformis]|uniref:Uncharacterized protein n=1 Tax=Cymbomonas tetramitiformis TaxID=36881 RepID=A0AAE0F2N8_9CHLO|nr:hypothetical protein CYMTET_41286 [Cymbomonas tetramitiformis]
MDLDNIAGSQTWGDAKNPSTPPAGPPMLTPPATPPSLSVGVALGSEFGDANPTSVPPPPDMVEQFVDAASEVAEGQLSAAAQLTAEGDIGGAAVEMGKAANTIAGTKAAVNEEMQVQQAEKTEQRAALVETLAKQAADAGFDGPTGSAVVTSQVAAIEAAADGQAPAETLGAGGDAALAEAGLLGQGVVGAALVEPAGEPQSPGGADPVPAPETADVRTIEETQGL